MRKATRTACALAAILSAGITEALAQEPEGAPGRESERLGEVNFWVSCDEAAQKEFNRAMALFHSLWFDPAIESFQKVLERDPACGMAYWGIALTSLGNPFSWPPNEKPMQSAAAAMEEAERVGAKTERERDYIAALGLFFKDLETAEYRPRAIAFEEAMARVAGRYPQDDEAQILYALILDATALPTDKTYANQRKAAGILEPLFKKVSQPPGSGALSDPHLRLRRPSGKGPSRRPHLCPDSPVGSPRAAYAVAHLQPPRAVA
jgi:tetratricopeptide (TPR) repeat protein